ncbi:hypothetical protein [Halodesulfovibrio sp.]|jgi:hypothetical protein|uniref:hypothetical protein n=1 Tax=Halodesulfovibrio sp. TaxID=1912772 RepID=UPI0025DC7B2B|nr:hypothetical protein [Halodesulfovibrio sp.]MCT4627936.1 hypothetical protein [Halodesulfovibrio sp.]
MPTIAGFIGTTPRKDDKLLPTHAATRAHNCKLERGHISFLHSLKQIEPCTAPDAVSFYKMRSGTFLFFDHMTEVIESAVTASGRVFVTGDEYPKQITKNGDTVSRLGMPRPSNSLGVSVTGSVSSGAEIVRSTSYVYTYVSEDGAESEPSPPTPVVDVKEGQGCNLTGFTLPDLAGVTIKSFRLYRTNVGTNGAEFQLVPYSANSADIPKTATSFADSVLDVNLSSEILPTEGWERLPDDAHSICLGMFGIYFAAKGKDIYVSETNIPYAYPPAYRRAVPYDLVSLAVADNLVYALTTGIPYALSGSSPESMGQAPIAEGQACVARKSALAVSGGVLYATPDGIGFLTAAGFKLVSQTLYTREQWRSLKPEQMVGAVHDGEYILFRAGCSDGHIYNMERADIRTFDFGVTVLDVHRDLEEDALYILGEKDGEKAVFKWGAGEPVPYVWQSKLFYSEKAMNMGAIRVSGGVNASTPCVVTVKSSKTEQQLTVTRPDLVMRLRSGIADHAWSITVSGTGVVSSIQFGTSIEAMNNGQ